MYNEALTVGETIELLLKFDPNLKVIAEGCDCENQVVTVEEQTRNFRVGDSTQVVHLGIRQ